MLNYLEHVFLGFISRSEPKREHFAIKTTDAERHLGLRVSPRCPGIRNSPETMLLSGASQPRSWQCLLRHQGRWHGGEPRRGSSVICFGVGFRYIEGARHPKVSLAPLKPAACRPDVQTPPVSASGSNIIVTVPGCIPEPSASRT